MVLLQPLIAVAFLSSSSAFRFQYGATTTLKSEPSPLISIIFTFQYGATTTNLVNPIVGKPSSFTFQYGATTTITLVGILY